MCVCLIPVDEDYLYGLPVPNILLSESEHEAFPDRINIPLIGII